MRGLRNHPYSVSEALWTSGGASLFHIHSQDEMTATTGEKTQLKKKGSGTTSRPRLCIHQMEGAAGFGGIPARSWVIPVPHRQASNAFLLFTEIWWCWKTVRNTRGAGDWVKDQPDPFLQQISSGKSSTSLTHKIWTFPPTCRDEICLFTVLAWWICRY